MANPTTYFGWVMPTSTDLVTDLPADFNVFGQGVDTSMQDLLGGTTGQVLSKTSGTDMDFTWVTPTDQTPLTTKGDIFAFSTVDARLPAGTNETRLVADSGETLGLKYVADTTNYAIAAKGDLLAGTAADTLQALSVGTNDQILVADSAEATGMKWATASSGGMTLLSTTTLSGSNSITISSISQSYTNLFVVMYGMTNATADAYRAIQPNATGNITAYFGSADASTVTSDDNDAIYLQPLSFQSTFNDANNTHSLWIYNYSNTTNYKPYSLSGSVYNTLQRPYIQGGSINTNSAISSLQFLNGAYNFTAGTVKIYGVN
jgi:hypothetical protein